MEELLLLIEQEQSEGYTQESDTSDEFWLGPEASDSEYEIDEE